MAARLIIVRALFVFIDLVARLILRFFVELGIDVRTFVPVRAVVCVPLRALRDDMFVRWGAFFVVSRTTTFVLFAPRCVAVRTICAGT